MTEGDTRTIRIDQNAYVLIHGLKKKLKGKVRRSVFYSDIIRIGVALISALMEDKPKIVPKMVDMAKAGDFQGLVSIGRDEIRLIDAEEVERIIRLLLDSGFPEASMKVLLEYQHLFGETKRNELAFEILKKMKELG